MALPLETWYWGLLANGKNDSLFHLELSKFNFSQMGGWSFKLSLPSRPRPTAQEHDHLTQLGSNCELFAFYSRQLVHLHLRLLRLAQTVNVTIGRPAGSIVYQPGWLAGSIYQRPRTKLQKGLI